MAKECFRLARETYTPITFYLSLTLGEFFYWRENIAQAINEDKRK